MGWGDFLVKMNKWGGWKVYVAFYFKESQKAIQMIKKKPMQSQMLLKLYFNVCQCC